MRVRIDIETRNTVLDVVQVGSYVYGADERTEINAISWNVDKGPIRRWLPLLEPEMPVDLRDITESVYLTNLHGADLGIKFVAHNVGFERNVLSGPAGQRIGFPDMMPIKLWDDTAARAAAFGLPRSLDGCAAALGLDTRKDDEGRRLMLQMTKPRKPVKRERLELDRIHGSMDAIDVMATLDTMPGAHADLALPFDSNTVILWHERPEQQKRQGEYCDQDVAVTTLVDAILPPLSETEQQVWELTEEMNDSGIPVDMNLLGRVIQFVEESRATLDATISERTAGAVPRISDHRALTRWLDKQGINDALTAGVAKDVVEGYLANPEIQGLTREVLLIRRDGGGSSTAKWDSMKARVSADGVARGVKMFCGAPATGRWSSRGIQTDNLPRGGSIPNILNALDDILAGATPQEIEFCYGPPLIVASELLRPALIAPEGHWLARGDYSQIEARMNPWLSGAAWKLGAFRAFDAGTGPDLYRVMAAKFYHIAPDQITPKQRQGAGKVPELALGFQGGAGALHAMGRAYGVHFTDAEAEEIKDAWRRDNPEIKGFWRALNRAAVECMQSPIGDITQVIIQDEEWNPVWTAPITFQRTNRAMAMRLPSGRPILYWTPRLVDLPVPWGGTRPAVRYRAEDTVTHQWQEFTGYGGLYCNNAVQGSARDVMAHALLRLVRRYDRDLFPRFSVHDEVICAALKSVFPNPNDAAEAIASEMRVNPPWCPDLPLAVESSAGPRYVKG